VPIYEYRCTNGHQFEALQRFSDAPLESCEVCEAPVHKVLSAPAVHFKGSGFYTTDYGRGKGARADGGGESGSGSSTSSGDKVSSSSSSSSSSDSSSSGSSSSSSSSGSSGSSSSSKSD
jgi:putative FmdB family regulatory protein